MKLAIMQPYLFPYIGYFQLIDAVDRFVFYDDVTYRKQSWINRNYILDQGGKYLITLHTEGASSFKLINEVKVGCNVSKLLKTIRLSYAKAPYYPLAFPLIESCLNYKETNLALFIINSIKKISEYLLVNTDFILSSDIKKNNELRGEEKIIHLCELLKADEYINALGGKELYNKYHFKKNDIILRFLNTKNGIVYKQNCSGFVPNLSIIDLLMFCSLAEIKQFLKCYELD